MTGAVPGGAPAPADPVRPGLRARLSSLQGHNTLCLPVGEIRDLVAALDAARADVERLTAQVATLGRRMERMEEPSQHVTWLGPDGEEYHPDWCRECRVDALRADVERLRGRTHEIQAQEMAKRAALDSELAEWRTRYEAAKEWTEEVGLTAEHAAGEWKYSPFWGLTSYNARSALLRLVTDRDEARAEVERLRGLWPTNGLGEETNVHQLVVNHRAWSKRAWEAQSAAETERDALRTEAERLREECNATADTVLELAAQRGAALADCRDLQREVELLRGQVGAWDSAQAVWDAIGRIRKSLGGDTDV